MNDICLHCGSEIVPSLEDVLVQSGSNHSAPFTIAHEACVEETVTRNLKAVGFFD